MRPRKDFFDTVEPLSEEEEREFAALQANMAMRLVMQKMQPQSPPGPAVPHDHLPRFVAPGSSAAPVVARGLPPVALVAAGIAAGAILWAAVCGLVLLS